MNVHDLLAWSAPALDALVLLGLGATWWQLRRDPTVAWREYEARLRELQESLRLLVLQAESEARDLDRRLAAHAEQLGAAGAERAEERRDERGATPPAKEAQTGGERAGRAKPRVTDEEPRITPLAAAMAATATVPTPPPLPGVHTPPPSLAERVQALAAAQTPIAEIARKLSLPIAEARVLADLTTGGLGFGAPAPAGGRADAATRAAAGRIAS
jgi:hypothetical protein